MDEASTKIDIIAALMGISISLADAAYKGVGLDTDMSSRLADHITGITRDIGLLFGMDSESLVALFDDVAAMWPLTDEAAVERAADLMIAVRAAQLAEKS